MKLKIILLLLMAYLLYALIFGVFIFLPVKKVNNQYKEEHDTKRFYSKKVGPDRALVIDMPKEAAVTRIEMLESAKKEINVSYFSMEASNSTTYFWGLLVDAANRGVKVRVIVDGVAGRIHHKDREILYVLEQNPNIELRLYEPPNPLLPWTFNNRLHDKFITVDGRMAIIGGRNIGDRFWAPESYKGEVTYDRDTLLYKADERDSSSVLNQLNAYFEQLYTSPYSKNKLRSLSKRKAEKGVRKEKELAALTERVRKEHPTYFNKRIDWEKVTLPTNKITLIHNPIQRFLKEPYVWYEISQLMESAKESVFIQSPYIVPTKRMVNQFMDINPNPAIKVKILTNSEGSTPNYFAFSMYMKFRDEILKTGAKVYEYQGDYSIHAKTYKIDSDLSVVGSFNLDPRSAYLSTESMIVVHGTEFQKNLDTVIDAYIEKSLLVGEDGEYVPNQTNIQPRAFSKTKDILLSIVGFICQFVEFLI